MSFRAKAVKPFNNMLRPLHMQLVPSTPPDPAIKRYIPARETIAAAQKAGLPVGTYIDRTFQEPDVAPSTVRAMLELAELHDRCEVICEIGAGSGMYAEEVIAALHPRAYEIYEPARDWLPHLRLLPNVVVRDCDGHSLSQTSEASVDLVHAHKVFVYLEFYTVAGYLAEMARVVRPGGTVAFDIVTENCLDEETVRKWMQLRLMIYRPIPRRWAVQFLQRRGLALRGSHLAPMPPGSTELLVFRRDLRSCRSAPRGTPLFPGLYRLFPGLYRRSGYPWAPQLCSALIFDPPVALDRCPFELGDGSFGNSHRPSSEGTFHVDTPLIDRWIEDKRK